MATVEQRLDALESREAIKELRSYYGWYAARGDVAGVASLFTEDGTLDCPDGPGKRARVSGRKNLEEFLKPRVGTKGTVIPLIHNHITEVRGDEASGSCALEIPSAPGFGHFVAHYIEKFARIGGKWYFSERRMYVYVPTREPEVDQQKPA